MSAVSVLCAVTVAVFTVGALAGSSSADSAEAGLGSSPVAVSEAVDDTIDSDSHAVIAALDPASPPEIDPHSEPVSEPTFWPDVVDTLDIVRSGVSPRELLDASPGFSSWIELGTAVPASHDLADLVARVEGVHVNSYGGLGAFSTATIRGSSSSQVQVVLDGVPLTSARDGMTNLGLIPLQVLDHARVRPRRSRSPARRFPRPAWPAPRGTAGCWPAPPRRPAACRTR